MKSEKHRKSITTSDKKVNSIANYVSVGGASATPSAASSTKATSDIRSTFSSTETLKAELLWTLQTVAKHQSYHSNDDIGALFTLMFPDSATAQGFSCGENKTAYLCPIDNFSLSFLILTLGFEINNVKLYSCLSV